MSTDVGGTVVVEDGYPFALLLDRGRERRMYRDRTGTATGCGRVQLKTKQ